jgi:hypothetical protein
MANPVNPVKTTFTKGGFTGFSRFSGLTRFP